MINLKYYVMKITKIIVFVIPWHVIVQGRTYWPFEGPHSRSSLSGIA